MDKEKWKRDFLESLKSADMGFDDKGRLTELKGYIMRSTGDME